jgi:chaperonin GroEL
MRPQKIPHKKLTFNNDAKLALARGVNSVAQAVQSTLGPSGQVVSIGHTFQAPRATKDGVTVALNIELKDPEENMGARYVIEAAQQTVAEAGDGTTTCTMLTNEILKQALELIIKENLEPVKLKREIERMVEEAVVILNQRRKTIEDDWDVIKKVAMVSANNNEQVADLIVQALKHVGHKGLVSMKDAKGSEDYVELVSGCDLDKGCVNPGFYNADKALCQYDNAYVVCVEGDLTDMKSMNKFWKILAENNKPVLFIADNFNLDILQFLLGNNKSGKMKVCAVRSPGFGDRRKQYMQDIAAITGGQVIGSPESGVTWANIKLEHLGNCEKFRSTPHHTVIMGGDADKERVERRLKIHENLLEDATEESTKQFYQKQIDRLRGGIAVIHVGGKTEPEQKEKKYLVEDAILATRAAVEEGVAPGGGSNFLATSFSLEKYLGMYSKRGLFTKQLSYQSHAARIVINALRSILKRLCMNDAQGYASVESRLRSFYDQANGVTAGYDAKKSIIVEDMMKHGIVDPMKVQRVALENASSIACLIISTECIISYEEKDVEYGN